VLFAQLQQFGADCRFGFIAHDYSVFSQGFTRCKAESASNPNRMRENKFHLKSVRQAVIRVAHFSGQHQRKETVHEP
jgi:hypothetical protein